MNRTMSGGGKQNPKSMQNSSGRHRTWCGVSGSSISSIMTPNVKADQVAAISFPFDFNQIGDSGPAPC
ncbi:hypothetical protein DTL21_28215 [Bremerella cremea]|uniref:Uncharacterized protein n=1 Tax=Blastopirellula marina TaxID=124 RepID=A0A2S8F8L1_9BACT|nr:hypothetical protein C5Y83_28170 [Blastopirellula marina]RCS41858.1 hypothetical protein DTL21_28215 [Bremerella cremea]